MLRGTCFLVFRLLLAVYERVPEVTQPKASRMLQSKIAYSLHLIEVIRAAVPFPLSPDIPLGVFAQRLHLIALTAARIPSSSVMEHIFPVLLIGLHEKFLRMRADLRAGTRRDQLLDLLPIFAINAKT